MKTKLNKLETVRAKQSYKSAIFSYTAAYVLLAHEEILDSLIDFCLIFVICGCLSVSLDHSNRQELSDSGEEIGRGC